MPARVRQRLFLFLFLVAVVAAALFAHWWLGGRHYQSTDNAYVQGDITRISSQLAAQITEVLVTDNQSVAAGELLVRRHDRDCTTLLGRASANPAARPGAPPH